MFTFVENEPLAHAAQARSLDDEPCCVTDVPAVQLVHAVQAFALAVLLNEPAAQADHSRSAVADPIEVT